MQHPIGQSRQAAQRLHVIKIATQHTHAAGMQVLAAFAAATEHGDPESPPYLLHDTHAYVAAAHDQQTGTAKTRRQGAKRVLN